MRTFCYFFGLRLDILLLRHSDDLSTSFQAENLCTAERKKIAKSTVNTLKSDEKFNFFLKDVKTKAAICIRCRPSEIAKKEKRAS